MCKFEEREEKDEEESQRHEWKDKSIIGQIAETRKIGQFPLKSLSTNNQF